MAFKDKEKEKAYYKEYREANKEKIKTYREVNKEKIKDWTKEYCEANKEKIKERKKLYMKTYYENTKHKKREYREVNKEKIKERKKLYASANKDKRKGYLESNKDKIRHRRLQRKYNITLEQHRTMMEAQGNMCKICRISLIGLSTKQIATDHCHKRDAEGKKVVRGILCQKCNTAIGMMQDNPKILRAAAKYLEDFEKSQQPKQLSLLGDE